jgi:hypothetical protein
MISSRRRDKWQPFDIPHVDSVELRGLAVGRCRLVGLAT